MASKPDLSTLPLHIIRISRKWYQNTKTRAYIPATNIAMYLPKPQPDAVMKHEEIMARRYDLKY